MKVFLLVVFLSGVLSSNPEENADPDVFEGDMILTQAQRLAAMMGQDVDKTPQTRGSIRSGLWTGGVIVYEIDGSLSRDRRAMNAITAGMKMWSDNTCIRFQKRRNEQNYARFYKGGGCSSHVGMTGGRQMISLASGCWYPGIVAHEIGHALGFYHEQSRPDRDDYVTIVWRNIIEDMKFNFNKYPRSTIDSLGTRYDYSSVMHYQSTAFSKNGGATIVAKQQGVTLGQRQRLSDIDIEQMNKLYRCSGGGGPGPSGDCRDANKHCSYWAGIGECNKNPNYMLTNCKKSCRQC